VAQYAIEKAMELGARVITASDSSGTVVDEAGFTTEKLARLCEIKASRDGFSKIPAMIAPTLRECYQRGARPDASACAGLMPTASRAGTVNNPPPPARASINPASMATKKSATSSSGDTINNSTKLSITVHAHPVAPDKKAAAEAVSSSQV
jgi:hypothetical protein